MGSCADPLTGYDPCSDPNIVSSGGALPIYSASPVLGTGDTFGLFSDNPVQDSGGSVPGSTTIPSSGTTISGTPQSAPSTFGNWSAILSGLGGLASGIAGAVRTVSLPATGSISPTATAATPYPVTVNGQTVGWSSVPQTPTVTGTGLANLFGGNSNITIIILALLGIFVLGRSRL